MKNLFKLVILLLVGYLLYRLYSAYLRPTVVMIDQQLTAEPPIQEQHPAASADAARPASASKAEGVNLNKAGMAELTSLPGIGPSLADRIIAFREQNGDFEAVDDLVQVQGIGSAQVERLRPLVAV